MSDSKGFFQVEQYNKMAQSVGNHGLSGQSVEIRKVMAFKMFGKLRS